MPFVSRDSNGKINAIYNQATINSNEQLAVNDPELSAFLSSTPDSTEPPPEELYDLRLSDLGLIRVLEDLVEVLIEKDVIRISDMPKIAIQRLKKRKMLRMKLAPYTKMMSGDKDTNVLNPDTWLDDDK